LTAHAFTGELIRWQQAAGRHDLPWQHTRDAYRVWLSEVMLQQTQVTTVLGYYERFVACFPTVAALAAAPLDEVMRLWSGLGYYSRARNLHRAAVFIVEHCDGRFPATRDALNALAGVGRSTAAAIAVFAHGAREAILDGNVKRVLARYFAIVGDIRAQATERSLWKLAESLLPDRDIECYTQGLMDLGATVCTPRNPHCTSCPLAASCSALRRGQVAELPARRAPRELPLRRAAVLVLQSGDSVLLEKRPPAGIWGGLWCLPELPAGADLASFVQTRFGCAVEDARALPLMRHSFTHFRLDISPLHVTLRAIVARAEDAVDAWHPLAGIQGIAAPAPVKRILRALDQRITDAQSRVAGARDRRRRRAKPLNSESGRAA
jgi:A/G-specific adenine glycosylase